MLTDRFRNALFEEDKSEKTISGYLNGVRSFNTWFEQSNGREPEPKDITSIDLREYKQYLIKTEKKATTTINYRLAAMRKYLTWANSQGLLPTGLPILPGEVKDNRNKIAPKSLTKKQQDDLLKVVSPTRGGNLRDETIITLLLNTGLRNSELRALRLEDLELSPRGGWLTVLGKGNKYRKIPLNNEARKILNEYLKTYSVEDFLFTGTRGQKKGKPLSDVGVQKIFNKYKDQLPEIRDDKDITVHSLRHTFATRMLEAGRNLVEVAALLGHENLNTTAIYTKPHPHSLRAAVESLCD